MEWIDVNDKLPDNTNDVLLWIDIDQGYFIVAYYEYNKWHNEEGISLMASMTHWMPIKAPKQ